MAAFPKQINARQRPSLGHGFSVDYSLDGIRHARGCNSAHVVKKVMDAFKRHRIDHLKGFLALLCTKTILLDD